MFLKVRLKWEGRNKKKKNVEKGTGYQQDVENGSLED